MDEMELDEGRNIIFENDEYLFMEILNAGTARYYGGEDFSKNWARTYREGDLFFLINKSERGSSIWIHIPNYDRVFIEDFEGSTISLIEFFKKFPQFKKVIMEKIDPFSMGAYLALKAIAEGVPPRNDWDMEQVDPLIGRFKYLGKNPKNSVVTLQFSDESDYFKTLDLSDDDLWVINIFTNTYSGGYDFVDYSDTYYWDEGHLFYYLNVENKSKINDILKYISPGLEISDDEETNKKIVDVLDTHYPEIGDSISSEYADYENQARNRKAREDIEDEFCEIYEKFNIFKKGCYYRYVTPVWNLIKLYEKYNVEHMDLLGLITTIGHTLSVWSVYESIHDTYGEDFDDEGFNRSVGYTIDKVYDNIDEHKFDEVNNVYNDVTKKFRFNRYYDFPSGDKNQFMIEKIDPTTAKLVVRMYGRNIPSGLRTISLEDFYTMIYNPTLFNDGI
jgi:hypothetical protein